MAVPTCWFTFVSSCCALPFRLTIAATNIKLAPSKHTIKSKRSGLRSTFLMPRIIVSMLVFLLSSVRLIGSSQDLGRFERGDGPCRDEARQQCKPNAHANDNQQRLGIKGGCCQVDIAEWI